MARKLVLITGASAGIGEEFARQYAQRGWDVALTARRADRLDKLARQIEADYRVATLTIPEDLGNEGAVDRILAAVTETGRHVDGLVNNAGYGLPGTFLNTSWDEQSAFMRVLFTAPAELVHKCLPSMAERKFGRIINVASVAGYAPGSKGHTLYGAVKAGLIKFSESIQAECDGLNIHCTALCPGFTYSEFHDVNGTRKATNEMPKWLWMDAGPVVEAGIEAVERGRPVIVPGGVNKGLVLLTKILPEPIARNVAKSQSKKFRRTESD